MIGTDSKTRRWQSIKKGKILWEGRILLFLRRDSTLFEERVPKVETRILLLGWVFFIHTLFYSVLNFILDCVVCCRILLYFSGCIIGPIRKNGHCCILTNYANNTEMTLDTSWVPDGLFRDMIDFLETFF